MTYAVYFCRTCKKDRRFAVDILFAECVVCGHVRFVGSANDAPTVPTRESEMYDRLDRWLFGGESTP